LARRAGAIADKFDLRRETGIDEPENLGSRDLPPFPLLAASLLRFSLALFLRFLTVPNMHIGFTTNP
jgi:hypothetical protein